MQPNPFQPPTINHPRELETVPEVLVQQRRSDLTKVGSVLFVLTGVQAFLESIPLIGIVLHLPSDGPSLSLGIGMTLFGGHFACLLTILFAGLSMSDQSSYRLAKTGAFLACLPIVTPFVVLGLPFGVWGFAILSQPSAHTLFRRH